MIYPAHYLEIVLADVIGGYGYGGRGEGLLQTKHNAAVTGGGGGARPVPTLPTWTPVSPVPLVWVSDTILFNKPVWFIHQEATFCYLLQLFSPIKC